MTTNRLTVGGVVAVLAIAGCGSTNPIDDRAQPVVDELRSAEVPRQYRSTYIPASPSPFLSCLQGVEEVEMTVDWELGVVRLQPRRDTPAVFVTETMIVVDNRRSPELLAWSVDLDSDALADVFGASVGALIETGIRSPDPNVTIDALIDIAISVQLTQPPGGLVGESISITVDRERFNAESGREPGSPAPRIVATINGDGLVTGYVVSDPSEDSDPDPDTNYAVVTDYEPAPSHSVPAGGERRSSIKDIAYPSPEDSCQFEG